MQEKYCQSRALASLKVPVVIVFAWKRAAHTFFRKKYVFRERKSYSFAMTQGWINMNRTVIFAWTSPLNSLDVVNRRANPMTGDLLEHLCTRAMHCLTILFIWASPVHLISYSTTHRFPLGWSLGMVQAASPTVWLNVAPRVMDVLFSCVFSARVLRIPSAWATSVQLSGRLSSLACRGFSLFLCTHTHTNERVAQGTLTPPSERSTVPAFHYRVYLGKHRSVGKSKPLDLLQSAVEDPRCPSWSLRASIIAQHDRVFILSWTANYIAEKKKTFAQVDMIL